MVPNPDKLTWNSLENRGILLRKRKYCLLLVPKDGGDGKSFRSSEETRGSLELCGWFLKVLHFT